MKHDFCFVFLITWLIDVEIVGFFEKIKSGLSEDIPFSAFVEDLSLGKFADLFNRFLLQVEQNQISGLHYSTEYLMAG